QLDVGVHLLDQANLACEGQRIRSPPNLDREILSFGVLEPGPVGRPEVGIGDRDVAQRDQDITGVHAGCFSRATGLYRRYLDTGRVRGAAQAEPRLTYGVRSQPHPCQLEHGTVGIRVPPVDVPRIEVGERLASARPADRTPPIGAG